MSQQTLARREREALCDLMLEVGPEAPTLCGQWTTRDLAAHLVLREGRPDAAGGILIAALASYTAKVQGQISARQWPDLITTLRSGPPRWSPQSIERLDVESNTVEFFVHHEDVRRAVDPWVARDLSADDSAQLWPRVGRIGKLLLRRCSSGVIVRPTDGPAAGTSVRLRAGSTDVALEGPVGEIVLALFGRPTAGLEMAGSNSDVAAFLAFPR